MSARNVVERVDPFDAGDALGWTKDPDTPRDLPTLRAEITQLDLRLIALLADRVELARRALTAKRESDLELYDPAGEAALVRDAAARAEHSGLDSEEVRELFWRIALMSRNAPPADAKG
jgi:chorismate mutase